MSEQAGGPDAQHQSTSASKPTESNPVEDQPIESSAERVLEEAEAALEELDRPASEESQRVPQPFVLEEIVGSEGPPEKCSLDLLRDVDLNVRIELGRTRMLLEDVLKLRRGSVVTLDKLAGDPVDVYVNGRLVARGEVLVLNENFCVRIGELIGSDALLENG